MPVAPHSPLGQRFKKVLTSLEKARSTRVANGIASDFLEELANETRPFRVRVTFRPRDRDHWWVDIAKNVGSGNRLYEAVMNALIKVHP